MSKLIVICGVTGNQGRSVAETFLKESGWRVRGISRDAEKPESKALSARGVEIVEADLNNTESLKATFQGAHVVFGNTVFPLVQAWTSSPQLRPNQTIQEWSYEREVIHGKNLADALAGINTLEQYIWSTLSNARERSAGRYRHVYHFDSKGAVVQYMQEVQPEFFTRTSFLQMGLFLSNWKLGSVNIPWQRREDGVMVLRMPLYGNRAFPHVLVEETFIYAKALLSAPLGTHLLAYSEQMTWSEFVTLWSKTLGIPAVLERVTLENMDKLAPGGLGLEIGEMHAYASQFTYWGLYPTVVFPDQFALKGQTTSIEQYIKREDWTELLNRPPTISCAA
ncbi:hypothetical protein CKM354_000785400 [Cercospora kikuchii]|uniref:NmrA-like domain-containing protein n=1 Tax=Cercospora kikuchii TaxID=84275 RepID=A0A9P3CKY5_9PEZI|nr:uncharacterized protein CKM354_000785400 [Cercospora kikuchii]GIZ44663.1 hypothetical protein CKM354_000785400 [Cercospora kikuchii]